MFLPGRRRTFCYLLLDIFAKHVSFFHDVPAPTSKVSLAATLFIINLISSLYENVLCFTHHTFAPNYFIYVYVPVPSSTIRTLTNNCLCFNCKVLTLAYSPYYSKYVIVMAYFIRIVTEYNDYDNDTINIETFYTPVSCLIYDSNYLPSYLVPTPSNPRVTESLLVLFLASIEYLNKSNTKTMIHRAEKPSSINNIRLLGTQHYLTRAPCSPDMPFNIHITSNHCPSFLFSLFAQKLVAHLLILVHLILEKPP